MFDVEDQTSTDPDLERAALRDGFAALAIELAALDGDWSRPVGYAEGDGPPWRARDLLAHITSTAAALPRMLSAPPPEPGSPDPAAGFDAGRWNASMIRRRAELPVADLVAENDAATRELEGLLPSLDLEAKVGAGAIAGMAVGPGLRYLLKHQRDHLADLTRVLA